MKIIDGIGLNFTDDTSKARHLPIEDLIRELFTFDLEFYELLVYLS